FRPAAPEPVAGELDHLVASEPPLANPESEPVHLREYRDLLQSEAAAVEHYHALLWVFPDTLKYRAPTELVLSGTREGDLLLQRLGDSMPPSLIDMGFR